MLSKAPKLISPELLDQIKESHFMLVDDEPLVTDFIQLYLQEAGYNNIISVGDPRRALKLIDTYPIDIVLLDLNMPGLTGFEVLKILRKEPRFKYLPIIVLSSSSDAHTKLQTLQLGATEFLSKPVDPSELILRVRGALTVHAYQRQLALYDALTFLPNRQNFIEKLSMEIKRNAFGNRDCETAVINIRVDQFRRVHNTLGPQIADELLSTMARTLSDFLQKVTICKGNQAKELWKSLSRTGADEFSLLLTQSDNNTVKVLVTGILKQLSRKYLIEGHEFYACASIGIAIHPHQGTMADQLIKCASSASAQSRSLGGNTFEFYCEAVDSHDKRRLRLDVALRTAIENREFQLKYQPKVDPKSGHPIGCEALLRWYPKNNEVTSPNHFIPMAEETGLIVPIGRWVMRKACNQLAQWHKKGYTNLTMAINVAAAQFNDVNFVDDLVAVQQLNHLDLSKLTVEITESTLIGDIELLIKKLNTLKELGVSISIDDFGTGYSSLSYLKRFPIDELKIDRSFIVDIPADTEDNSIVQAIISLAQNLRLKVVAEGVERSEQLKFLNNIGCDCIQGYYYSKPLSSEEFEQYLQANYDPDHPLLPPTKHSLA